jgi:hypothetical protein
MFIPTCTVSAASAAASGSPVSVASPTLKRVRSASPVHAAELIGNPSPEVREMTELLFAQDQPAYYDTIINWGLDRSPINYLDELN